MSERETMDCDVLIVGGGPAGLGCAIRLISDAADSFRTKCVDGLELDTQRVDELMRKSLMLVTALAPEIGYDKATEIAKTAHKNGTTLKEEALNLGYVTAEEFEKIVRPEKMISPQS